MQTPGLLIGAVAPLLGVISPLLVELELYTKSRLLICKCVCVHASVYVYLFKTQVTTLCMKELCMSGSSSFLCNLCIRDCTQGLNLCVCVCSPQAYGVGGMRKRQEPPAIEDRDKPYVCDSEQDRRAFIPDSA